MSGVATADAAGFEALRRRLDAGLRQIAFFVVPSAMAFLALGDVIAAALFADRPLRARRRVYVWGILAGSAVGLLASTLGRPVFVDLLRAARHADAARFALVRVALTTALGYLCDSASALARDLERWGAAGLTASAGIAGWVEMLLLRRTLNARIGQTGLPFDYVLKLWTASAAGAAVAWAIKVAIAPANPILAAMMIRIPYGFVFFAVAFALQIPEASAALARVRPGREA